MTEPAGPALRYHGAKWRLAPWIISHFGAHRIFVEAFGGSAAVLLRKPKAYAEVYNDLHGDVVNLFRVLRDPDLAAALERAVRLTPFARAEFEAAAPADVSGNDPVEKARQLIVRAYQGFGSNSVDRPSGFRTNSDRSGSTPAHDWARWPARIEGLTARLSGVVIENRPAFDVSRQFDGPDTLHYWDPPYLAETRTARRGYLHDFTDEDHREMAAAAGDLKGMVIISGYPSALYDDLFGDWPCVSRAARACGAAKRTECLWFNKAAWIARPTRDLFEVSARDDVVRFIERVAG